MKNIDININQAKILSYSVELKEDSAPEVGANIGLFSGKKQISTFSLRTQTCYSNSLVFELPAEMIEPIVKIANQLEIVLVRECNKQLKRLPANIIENKANNENKNA